MPRNSHLLTVVLTAINLVMLVTLGVASLRPAQAQTIAPVLRGRALELVDEHGRVRAELRVMPADPTVKMPDGTTGYPETMLLRLMNSTGAAKVKLEAAENGGGFALGGDGSYVQVSSKSPNPFVKIVSKDGREQIITP
jgi:hypothetical protein